MIDVTDGNAIYYYHHEKPLVAKTLREGQKNVPRLIIPAIYQRDCYLPRDYRVYYLYKNCFETVD
jgi:hypothetical protein